MEIIRIVLIAIILEMVVTRKEMMVIKYTPHLRPSKHRKFQNPFSRAPASSGPASAQTLAAHPCPVVRGRDFKIQKGVVLKVLVKKGPLGIHLLKRGS